MRLRRLSVVLVAVCALGVWGVAQSGGRAVRAQSDDANRPGVETHGADGRGNHDEAAARFRANQSHHWRQVTIGSSTTH